MTRKSMLIAVLLTMLYSTVQADSPDSSKKDPYFKLGANVQNESGDKAKRYVGVVGIEYDDHVVMQNFLVVGKTELYYQSKEVKLGNKSTKTDVVGLGLASLKYTGFVKGNNSGYTPYLSLSLERIDTKKVDGPVVVTETNDVVAWTAGIKTKLNGRFSINIFHVWKLSKPFSDEVANETDVALIYTFPI